MSERRAKQKISIMKSDMQKHLDELEAAGLIIRTGETPSPITGEPQPAYVIAPKYANDPEAADKVLAAMDMARSPEPTTAKAVKA